MTHRPGGAAAGVWSHDGDGGAQGLGGAAAGDPAACCAEAGLRLADLDAIAFGRGPGAFTGLRTACSVAQGLAFGAGKPVLPIDSLLSSPRTRAAPARRTLRVWAAMDARMGEIYAAEYRYADGRWTTLRGAAAVRLRERCAPRWRDAPPEVVAGDALARVRRAPATPARRGAVPRRAPTRAALLAPGAQAPGATAPRVDAAEALPLYVRDKVAQTTREREAARAAAAT